MSTRCQVIIKDDYNEQQWFYRHSDGYPEGVTPTLDKFCEMVNEGQIRGNTEQCAGWLVILGAIEYQTVKPECFKAMADFKPSDWKVGAYEPCEKHLHGDIEHCYVVSLKKDGLMSAKASWQEVNYNATNNYIEI